MERVASVTVTPAHFGYIQTGTEAVVERVGTAGCPVIVLTVDLPGGSNRLTPRRLPHPGHDAIWVSNHGGRSEGSGQATIDALPEIANAVNRRVPVIVDGGFRRGSDIFKGIARGADAVAVGRPYLWGLGAFGQPGVERVLEILRGELAITMRLACTPSLASIGASSIGTE